MDNKRKPYDLWVAMVLVALVLIPAGAAKLAGVPQLHASFAALGLPTWFGYFVGACEIAGAIGIFIRRVSVPAATGVVFIMLGALYFHVTHTPLVQGIPAFVVLVLCLYVIWKRSRAPRSHVPVASRATGPAS